MNKIKFLSLLLGAVFIGAGVDTQEKSLIAHRGASAYAPEHTLEAYQLAIDHGADYVEQDLQITWDGVLVCLHDSTLERTSNVEEVFPERFRVELQGGKEVRRWYVSEFTLEEIKRLDAGSWFGEQFQDCRIPTFREAIQLVKGKAGLYPETKSPDSYAERGYAMEGLLLEDLAAFGLMRKGQDPETPVIVQSFSAQSLERLSYELESDLPLVLLIAEKDRESWVSVEALERIQRFAVGIGPAKIILEEDPGLVRRAQNLGLTVTPYTFRSASVGKQFAGVGEEMFHYLFELGVDALFTDNPDLFPRRR